VDALRIVDPDRARSTEALSKELGAEAREYAERAESALLELARNDLTTLVNVNVLFLGFQRQLNEIDATFKHAYIEGSDFGGDDMQLTVGGSRQRSAAHSI
jgi:hypothetical protein